MKRRPEKGGGRRAISTAFSKDFLLPKSLNQKSIITYEEEDQGGNLPAARIDSHRVAMMDSVQESLNDEMMPLQEVEYGLKQGTNEMRNVGLGSSTSQALVARERIEMLDAEGNRLRQSVNASRN